MGCNQASTESKHYLVHASPTMPVSLNRDLEKGKKYCLWLDFAKHIRHKYGNSYIVGIDSHDDSHRNSLVLIQV